MHFNLKQEQSFKKKKKNDYIIESYNWNRSSSMTWNMHSSLGQKTCYMIWVSSIVICLIELPLFLGGLSQIAYKDGMILAIDKPKKCACCILAIRGECGAFG